MQELRRHLHVFMEGVLCQPVPLRAAKVMVRGVRAQESLRTYNLKVRGDGTDVCGMRVDAVWGTSDGALPVGVSDQSRELARIPGFTSGCPGPDLTANTALTTILVYWSGCS